MNKTIGLVSIHTGFNYGTMLQCYAMNRLIEEIGYTPTMLWGKEGIIKGRDVTFKKMFTIAYRLMLHPKACKKTVGAYVNTMSMKMSEDDKNKFLDFSNDYFDTHNYSDRKLKKIARNDNMIAVVCGSDQIWNADSLYLSPYYYLRFVPNNKKIAYAPSFGKEAVPYYNKKKVAKYINDFNCLSIREHSGQRLIRELTGRYAKVVLDPTLTIHKSIWDKIAIENDLEDYIIMYFLNDINTKYRERIKTFIKHKGFKVIYFPYKYEYYDEFDNIEKVSAGPKEFIGYIKNAKFVFTDSYHGMIFSIIYNVPFYGIEREYKNASKQNSRIETLMKNLELEDRYVTDLFMINNSSQIDYSNVNKLIIELAEVSKKYLINCVDNIGKV